MRLSQTRSENQFTFNDRPSIYVQHSSVSIASVPLLCDFAKNVGLGVWLSESAVNMLLG